jgi:hypothetical protein
MQECTKCDHPFNALLNLKIYQGATNKYTPSRLSPQMCIRLLAIYSILRNALFNEIFHHFMGPNNRVSQCTAL